MAPKWFDNLVDKYEANSTGLSPFMNYVDKKVAPKLLPNLVAKETADELALKGGGLVSQGAGLNILLKNGKRATAGAKMSKLEAILKDFTLAAKNSWDLM